MILHNQQAVPRLQIHRFSLLFASFFRLIFHVFSCFFEARFRYRFLIVFVMEKGTKMTSKIDPRGDLCDQIVDFPLPGECRKPSPSRPFFGHRFLDAFWSPFGALLVNVGPFWLHFGPCWLHVGPFWFHFGSILDAPGWFLQELNRIWNRSSQVGFSQRIWSQNEKIIKPTHHKETNP